MQHMLGMPACATFGFSIRDMLVSCAGAHRTSGMSQQASRSPCTMRAGLPRSLQYVHHTVMSACNPVVHRPFMSRWSLRSLLLQVPGSSNTSNFLQTSRLPEAGSTYPQDPAHLKFQCRSHCVDWHPGTATQPPQHPYDPVPHHHQLRQRHSGCKRHANSALERLSTSTSPHPSQQNPECYP